MCVGGVLMEYIRSSVGDSLHPWPHNVPQRFLVDLRADPQALWEEQRMTCPSVGMTEMNMIEEGILVQSTTGTS